MATGRAEAGHNAGLWFRLIPTRSRCFYLILFYAVYVVAGGLSQELAIIPGVAITFWPPAGLFLATLLMNPRGSWPWWILAGCLAELTCNGIWFGNAIPFALIYFAANALEAIAGAWLLKRFGPRPMRLDSLTDVAIFVMFAVGLAPTVGATVIATTDALIGKHAFETAWTLVWLGDSTGLLVSAPLAIVANLAWRERRSVSAPRCLEALAIGTTLIAVTAFSFIGIVPTVYLALPPLLWIAARFQLRGAAVGLGIMTLVVAAFVATETGIPAGIPEDVSQRIVAVQTFLGLSAVSALVVAAISAEHRRTHRLLQSANASLEARVVERTVDLADSERRLSAVLEALPIGVAMVDRDGRQRMANAVFAGYSPTVVHSQDGDGRGLWEGYYADGRRIEVRDFPTIRALRGERVWPGEEFLFHGKDGTPVWTRVAAIPLQNENAEIIGATAVISDIDREKRSIDALRESERRLNLALTSLQATDERLTMALDAGHAGIWESVPATGEFVASEAALRLHGLAPGTPMTHATALIAIHPDDRPKVDEALRRTLETGQAFELDLRCIRPDGEIAWLHSQAELRLDGPHPRFVGLVQDITERKKVEERTRASEARLSRILKQSPAGIVQTDAKGRMVLVNERWCEMVGYSETEMLGMSITDVAHASSLQATLEAVRRLAEGGPDCQIENEYRCKNGKMLRAQSNVAALRDAEGNFEGVLAVVLDLTERFDAEARLRESEEQFRQAADATRALVYSVDLPGGENARAYGVAHIVGEVSAGEDSSSAWWHKRIHPDDRPSHLEHLERCLEDPACIHYHASYRVRHRDGAWRDVEDTARILRSADGQAARLVGAIFDVTTRKQAEEREKLLVQEVNHRAKNMLAVVQAIARQTAAVSPKDFVERFAERVQALSVNQNVLVKSGWRSVPLYDLAHAQFGHFSDLIDRRIRLSGPPLAITAAAAQTIGMALHELATNAAKYGALCTDTGTVTVTWRLAACGSEPRFVLSWVEAGGPFVTKPTRRGFGSMVTGDLMRMSLNGEVETEFAAQGLIWKLSCPASSVSEGGATAQQHQTDALTRDTGQNKKRILVVEDEPLIALDIAAILKQAGFDVLGPVGSVGHALALLDRSGCDAAILDVNLGDETAESIALRLSSSHIPFVAVSGYSADQLPPEFGSAPLVGKPLSATLVVNSLQRCLTTLQGRPS